MRLDISPVVARPMERVNLTGTYKGADNVGLQVQRFEDGNWRDFGVTATVKGRHLRDLHHDRSSG